MSPLWTEVVSEWVLLATDAKRKRCVVSNSSANGTAYGRDQALAWIESTKLMLGTRPGFNWLKADLDELSAYVGRIATENEALYRYLDEHGERGEFERYLAESTRPPLA